MPDAGLRDYQRKAVAKMKNGCILCGGVGSGKSRTSLAYYSLSQGESIDIPGVHRKSHQDLYIITTARKRDSKEWDGDMIPFLLSPGVCDEWHNMVVVDSWNNIGKYADVSGAFFIFDEQRVIGSGAWTRNFLKIAKKNAWVLLSATPGDTWLDYIPVFVANGFYKNRSEFLREHVIFKRFAKFPQVDRYVETNHLEELRREILVDMPFRRETKQHHETIYVSYDVEKYKFITKNRQNIFENGLPLQNAAELCFTWRRLVNSAPERVRAVIDILKKHPKAIVFYNFDFELELLKKSLTDAGLIFSEWNGHVHEPIREERESWAYLVQYTAGCEGWNCTSTDTTIFYSQNYSYKVMTQAAGRIDRMNTPFTDLWYYHLKSRSPIDLAIGDAIEKKKTFNARAFVKWE